MFQSGHVPAFMLASSINQGNEGNLAALVQQPESSTAQYSMACSSGDIGLFQSNNIEKSNNGLVSDNYFSQPL